MPEKAFSERPVAPPAWRQLGVLVNDGSELEGIVPATTKAAAVDVAVRGLLNRMKAGTKPADFSFSFVSFNDHVTDERPPTELLQISTEASFDPTAHGIGGTAISTGSRRGRHGGT